MRDRTCRERLARSGVEALAQWPHSRRPDYIGRISFIRAASSVPFLPAVEAAGARVYNYLIMTAGPRSGTQFLLDEGKQNRIGRGLDCDVILADPLSSRVHAVVLCEEG